MLSWAHTWWLRRSLGRTGVFPYGSESRISDFLAHPFFRRGDFSPPSALYREHAAFLLAVYRNPGRMVRRGRMSSLGVGFPRVWLVE
ncbi:hypothetical protein CDAR_50911 [Caerostris darwini]|uniref:Uncharacterized protein n=1 Tax=Caerostris darwini TaxID=1538125 RepID=A0AAV4U5Q0_9ARAC|nr:hypothetical protein CDAR_50911 [Caerostris darwini]